MRKIGMAFVLFLGIVPAGCDRGESESVEKTTVARSDPDVKASEPEAEPLPSAPVSEKPLYAKSFINRPAPEFVVAQWLNREPDREGKLVLIDFWADYCDPCIESIPKLNRFHRNHKNRLVVIGVSSDSAEVVRNHRGAKINYALAIDPERRMYNELGITHIPNVFIIDPTCIVRWQGNPYTKGHELTEEVLVELLDTYVR